MKLTQLFSGEVRTDTSSNASNTIQLTPSQAQQLNRQIRSLVPGQTISGEIVSRNGGEVQIRLSDDLVLNARVDRSMNIEIGKNMTFEVKNNGSALTLSPLFTNVATDMNVLKALDMAGLPVNRMTVDMTQQLMSAGLPVNKNILQQIFREINGFPENEVSDVIGLHRLQMPVNETNMAQMASYRNLTHQLTGGMETILEALPEVFDSMTAEGNSFGAVKLYQEVLQLLQEGGGEGVAGGETLPAGGGAAGNAPVQEGILPADIPAETEEGETQAVRPGLENAGEASRTVDVAGTARDVLRAAVAREAMGILDHVSLSSQETSAIGARFSMFAQGQLDLQQFFADLNTLAEGARTSSGAMQALEKLFSGDDFRELLAGALKNSWTLDPEDVAVPGRVEELYRRLDRQLKGLTQVLENAGQSASTAFRAAASMSQNVDFLQQLNQMYAYVQLPLRLQQGNAHGDLYVYTNRKSLAGKDGNVSALLHLDMEHLGPVDVYVAMQNTKVSTKFYLQDEEMIDFMAAHMDILTERLKKRGYDCSCSMTTRQEEPEGAAQGGLNPILGQEKGVMISQYAFDVRT